MELLSETTLVTGIRPVRRRNELPRTMNLGTRPAARLEPLVPDPHGRPLKGKELQDMLAVLRSKPQASDITAVEGDLGSVEDDIRDLLHDMLMLQAAGDYEGTKRFLDKYGKPQQSLLDAIGRLNDVPVDIRAVYTYK